MRYKRKTRRNRKKTWSALSIRKNVICTGKKKDKKENIQKSRRNYKILELPQQFALDK